MVWWFGGPFFHGHPWPGPGVSDVSGACQLWCTRSRRQVDPNILKSQILEEWRSMKIHEDLFNCAISFYIIWLGYYWYGTLYLWFILSLGIMILIYYLIAPYLQQKTYKNYCSLSIEIGWKTPVAASHLSWKFGSRSFRNGRLAMLCLPTWRGAKSWKSSDFWQTFAVACGWNRSLGLSKFKIHVISSKSRLFSRWLTSIDYRWWSWKSIHRLSQFMKII